MVNIKGFKAYKLEPEYLSDVPIETNDNLDFTEGREEVRIRDSFLKIHRPEFEFDEHIAKDKTNMYDILHKGKMNLKDFIDRGIFKKTDSEVGFLYRQILEEREQCGLLFCISDDDYVNKKVLPHEQTFEDRVSRLQRGADHLGIYNSFPLTFSEYNQKLADIIEEAKKLEPTHELTRNKVTHYLYALNEKTTKIIIDVYRDIDHLYIADGHHRFESYSREVAKLKQQKQRKTVEDYDYYPVLIYPEGNLQTYGYHRIVRNLSFDDNEILEKAKHLFEVKKVQLPEDKSSEKYKGMLSQAVKPNKKSRFLVFLRSTATWYRFKVLPYKPSNIIESLDISYLSSKFFEGMLDINDLKTTQHVDYVPETNGTVDWLEEQTLADKSINMLIMCPKVELAEVKSVADFHVCMPPKSTFVYPKPLIGLLFKAFESLD